MSVGGVVLWSDALARALIEEVPGFVENHDLGFGGIDREVPFFTIRIELLETVF